MMMTTMMMWSGVFFLALTARRIASQAELRLKPLGDSFTKPVGNSILFTCEVTGNVREGTQYNLRWFDVNNNEITEKSGRLYVEEERSTMKKLYITNIDVRDEGRYRCTATIDGIQQEKTVSLVLFKDITFEHAPSPQHPQIYTDALIECRVSGSPPPHISWRYKGERIAGDRYTEDSRTGIRIQNITREDDGEYTCRAEVEADGRYNERKISVIVHIPPKVLKGPGISDGIEGEEKSIYCKADGLPPPKYEFLKDDSLMPLQSTFRILVDADLGTVQFKPLNKSDEGRYTCRVHNGAGYDSSAGEVKVLVRPAIFQFTSITQTEGQSSTLQCLSHGDPAPAMSFTRSGRQLDYFMGSNEDGRVVVNSPGKGRLHLTFSSLIPDDTSNYTCKSVNRIGSSEHSTTVTVRFRPRFPVNHTREVFIWPGKLRNITCHVEAEPVPSIEWFKFNRPLSNNDTFRIYSMGRESSLEIRVREEEQGWIYGSYKCQAKNTFGTTEHSIELRRATVPKEPRTIFVRKLMTNTVILDVIPPDEDGGEVITGFRVEYEERTQDFMTAVNLSREGSSHNTRVPYVSNPATFDVRGNQIVINNLKPSTTYSLKIRAKNDVGVGIHREQLVTTEPIKKPYPIEIISKLEANAFDYKIEWTKPDTGGIPILQYEFKYRKMSTLDKDGLVVETAGDWQTFYRDDNSHWPMMRFDLHGLVPRSTYQLQIRARNNIDWSETYAPVTFRTRDASAEELASIQAAATQGIVVGVVVALCIIILIVIDISCYFINGCGVTMLLCVHVCGKNKSFPKEKAMEEGESAKNAVDDEDKSKQNDKTTMDEQQLKENPHDGGKNGIPEDSKEEITLEEKKKLMDEKIPVAGKHSEIH